MSRDISEALDILDDMTFEEITKAVEALHELVAGSKPSE